LGSETGLLASLVVHTIQRPADDATGRQKINLIQDQFWTPHMARLAQAVGLGPFFLSRFSALSELISRSTVAHLSNIVVFGTSSPLLGLDS
jgi:hypothetical protein